MERRSQAKSKLKRQRDDNGNDQQRKGKRLPSPAEPEHTTKIIDLNDDCLRKIFGHLELESLFSVVVANEWLRSAACDVYKRKFGSIRVEFKGCDDFCPNTRENVQFKASALVRYDWRGQKYINIKGLRPSLLYLRCFGPAITNLLIDYSKSESKRYHRIHQYVNEYCAESLTHISFCGMPKIAIQQFQTIFVRIEYGSIGDCDLGAQWSDNFVKLFPNLRHLEIEQVDMASSGGLKKPFEHLEHLEISQCDEASTKQLAVDLLQNVHRLRSLKMKYINEANPKDPITVLLDMIKNRPQITELTYSFNSFKHMPVSSADVQRIVVEHAALVEIRLEDYQFTTEDVFVMIRQMNALNRFRFQVRGSEYMKLISQLDRSKWEIIGDYFNGFSLITLIRKNVQ